MINICNTKTATRIERPAKQEERKSNKMFISFALKTALLNAQNKYFEV